MQVLKSELREKIIKSAIQEFKRNKYKDASMRRIAQAANISVGNLYRYFSNKEALFDTIVLQAYEKITDFILDRKDMLRKRLQSGREYFEQQYSKLAQIYVEHRDELLIVINNSEGTKFEGSKEKIIELVEDVLKGEIENKIEEGTCVTKDSFFAHVLAVSAVEGSISILEQYSEKEKIVNMLEKFFQYMFENFHERIEK